ncbi:thioredoxin family protein [Novipirellula artificiosorum]|uniref:Putative peroxiredoxin n=1 Tax=Novipirellula artificiosorum TaxID=2528016 RepID=A0A5C6D9W0_9BACT|nr:thioredoxin family protein [Novipirellula artificiosorum]TWU32584.1 putative peroxiredoxin [Novipirellula artificiosorum]
MVRTASTMLPLGTSIPDFQLPDCDGQTVSLADFSNSKALLVIFMCNHCPFVKHVAEQLRLLSDEYMAKGVGVVGISSNDAANYPEDSPAAMKQEKADRGYSFAYLYDEDQSVAMRFHAACTPDFFLFAPESQAGDMKLAYRGQLDSSRPKTDIPVTGVDLRAAIDAVLAGDWPSEKQTPSIGCNIKWKQGNEPEYFNPQGTA